MPTNPTIADAYRGCVVVFRRHKLRVESEPLRQGARVRLEGRENRGACAFVRRWYFASQSVVRIEAFYA